MLMPKSSEKLEMKIFPHGNRSYQLTSAGQSGHGWRTGWHWLAGNSFLPRGRIFISSFSELLCINIEGLNSLLLGT